LSNNLVINAGSKLFLDGITDVNQLLNYKVEKDDIQKIYRLCEYFYTFTIVGTAIDKLAEFPLAGIYVVAKSAKTRKKVNKYLRSMEVTQKIKSANINSLKYGLSVISVMLPSQKVIICNKCGTAYQLKDLAENGEAKYKYVNGKFKYKCTNEECENKGMLREFASSDKRNGKGDKLRINVRSPYQITNVTNEITGEKQWYFQIPPSTKKLILQGNHFVLCTTPEMFLKAGTSSKAMKILLDENSTFIFETNENYIHGMPIPPMARALRTLMRREKFHKANSVIAEEMLVPLRMMFPIDRSGGTNMPTTQSRVLSLSGHSDNVRTEIEKWRADKSYIPIMPIEVGSKDFWGNGKMLALEPLLDMTTKDLLAELGIQIEFIYGGATWSRQNVSAIVLENTIANMTARSQQLLDYISEKLQEVIGKDETISIQVKTPRIVEGLAELSFLKEGKDNREITEHTYWGKLGIDADAQQEMLPEEDSVVKDRTIDAAKRITEAEIESARIKLIFRKEQSEIERKEALKDSIAMGAIKADEMASEIKAKKEMLRDDIAAQEYLAGLNHEQQKDMLSKQDAMQVDQMSRSIDDNIRMMSEQMKIQTEGMKQQARAQVEIDEEMAAKEQEAQESSYIDKAMNTIEPEEKKLLEGMSEEEQKDMLLQKGQKIELDEYFESLSESQKGEFANLSEEEKYSHLSQMMQSESETAALEQENPAAAAKRKEVEDEKLTEEEEIYNLAEAMRGMIDPQERQMFEAELMNEDATKYSKVKNQIKQQNINVYVERILSSKPGEETNVITALKQNNPSIADEVINTVKQQLAMQEQAKLYAHRLYQYKDAPEDQQKLIQELNDGSPEIFRAQVMAFYERYMQQDVTDIHLKAAMMKSREKIADYHKLRVLEISSKLKSMNEDERKSHLEIYKVEDPDMYKELLSKLGTSE